MIHGVELLDRHHPVRQDACRVEQRGCISPSGDDDAPEMAHIAEEYRQRREQKAQPCAEQQHVDEEQRQKENVDRRYHSEKDHDGGNGNERKAEVDKRKEDFLQRKDHLFDADFLDEGR